MKNADIKNMVFSRCAAIDAAGSFEKYEVIKQELRFLNLSPDQYEFAIKCSADYLKI